ncbi:iron-containing alcohol dehydrogenase [Alteribacillus sp. YIM 98480]|uniref:iron-containing alcohol dehydrogenase n=1 Tax=Alteribacillus sp. YIM 98480 TaxID=2606599 RepID=UPI00131D0861|nr:iron-containing alcohol dehydrogenase [Alteribacillus sp. YIM 98480]
MITKFIAPEIIFGEEAIQQTGESFLRLGAQRVLIVSDPGVAEAGWTEKAIHSLTEASLTCISYFEATTNPQVKEVEKGAQIYIENECDAVLGVGGGSALDVAKAIAVLVSNGGKIEDYEGIDKIKKPLPPTIMISTTSGSGSEVSQFAIILDPARKKKMTIVSKSLVPDIAIIDPFTLMTKDSLLTAATGLDVLTHAIEAYVSVAATPLTDVQAVRSMELAERYLRPSVASKTNLEAKKAMAMSSLQAGLAFSNAILGAVHAMSHAIGGQYELSHGEINSILLPHVMEFNFIAAPERFAHIGTIFCKQEYTDNRIDYGRGAIAAIRNLADDIGAPKTLREAGLKKPDYELMADIALNDACMVTNPRDVTKKDIEQLLQNAY